jgi:hypothetical protein
MKPSNHRLRLASRIAWRTLVALIALYFVLLIPERQRPAPVGAGRRPFSWSRDAFWSSLERQFQEDRLDGCEALAARIDAVALLARQQLDAMTAERLACGDARFDALETNLFLLAPMVAACPKQLPGYLKLYTTMREAVKRQSEHWNMESADARERIYRLLFGGRAALEEVMLQAPDGLVPAMLAGADEPSRTPDTHVLGVAIHSGDILVSRGGAPTSALIARGNDFPGNFSHIALAHVDEKTRAISVVEAHIEKGVVVSSFADYLADTKLRVMALRLRSDLPQLMADPMLPHKAASLALQQATARHIPYDFAMDYHDHSRQFCSEVASAAYEQCGVRLWMGISHISSRGVALWLSAFGVKHFSTHEPSDLEYDPQLRVVAEWREPGTLFQDHADNAVIDAMLEEADRGEQLDYPRFMLPFARLAKGHSAVLNTFGQPGPVPEGMSATAAMRHRAFSKKHAAIKARLLELAAGFNHQKGYNPPYWELVKLAREAMTEIKS